MTQTHSIPSSLDSVESPPSRQPAQQLGGYRRGFDIAYAWLSGLFLLAILAQMFLAGLGAFQHKDSPGPGFGPHVALGNRLGIAAGIIFLVALIAWVSWRIVACALVLAVLSEGAQHALAQFGWDNQWIGAAHALDGMVILLLAAGIAVTSYRRVRRGAAG